MFLDSFYQNPLLYIGLAFSIAGAFGAGLFVAGFFAGLPHLFTISGDDEHLERHRRRITWGVLILIHTFILWEIVRLVASWFGGPYVDPSIVSRLLGAYVLTFIVLFIAFGITNVIVGKEH